MEIALDLLVLLPQAQDPAKPAEAPAREWTSLKVPYVDEATLGGQIRLRGEVKDPVDYRLPGANGRSATEDLGDGDEYVWLRVRAHLDLKIRKDIRAFLQVQDSRSFGEEAGVVTDLEGTDLHQGWVEVSNLLGESLSLKAGRTEVPLLGDDDPSDGDRGTFDPLLSFGHAYHGYYDLVLWKNVHTFMASLRAQPVEGLTVGLDAHFFRLDEDRDAWYSVPAGTVVRRDATGQADRDLGWEIDLHAKIRLFEKAEAWVGVSHFEVGDYVEDTGPAPDGNWVFAQVTVNF